jgi:hypothetical protein
MIENDVEYEYVLFDWRGVSAHEIREKVDEMLDRKARDGWRLVGVTGNFPAREWWFSRGGER